MSKQATETNKEYVHKPGTVHLNAFEADVRNAQERVKAAEAELEAAKHALEQKKASSRFEEV